MSIRTMLVEDEWLIREALLRTVPWEQYGFEIAGEAGNGADALEMFIRLRPDVIITDIRMPGMDGLELIACIREISPTVLICILSSHTDFQLARQGIRYGVFEYLDKLNLSSGEIEHCLERLHDTFHGQSREHGVPGLPGAAQPEVQMLGLQSPSAWLKQFRPSAGERAGWRWVIMLMDRESWEQTDIHAWLEGFPYPGVIAERRMFVDAEQRLHLILEDEIEVPALLLERYEDTGILISSRVARPDEWEKAYREAEELQSDLFYTGWNHAVEYECKRVYQVSVPALAGDQEDKLIALLAVGNANAIMECMDEMLQDAQRRSVHPKRLIQALTLLLMRHIPRQISSAREYCRLGGCHRARPFLYNRRAVSGAHVIRFKDGDAGQGSLCDHGCGSSNPLCARALCREADAWPPGWCRTPESELFRNIVQGTDRRDADGFRGPPAGGEGQRAAQAPGRKRAGDCGAGRSA